MKSKAIYSSPAWRARPIAWARSATRSLLNMLVMTRYTYGWYILVSGLKAAQENQKWLIDSTGASYAPAGSPASA